MKNAFHVVLVSNHIRVLKESMQPQLENLSLDARIALLDEALSCKNTDEACRVLAVCNVYPVNLNSNPIPLCMLFDKHSVFLIADYINRHPGNQANVDCDYLRFLIENLGTILGMSLANVHFNMGVDMLHESLFPSWTKDKTVLWKKIVVTPARKIPFRYFQQALTELKVSYENKMWSK